jgi:ketosteroid isomerase-like protein
MLVVVVALVVPAAGLLAQRGQVSPQLPTTEEQKVEIFLSEMLAAWQIGDVELLHKYHADDVVVVSGVYEPPITGWTNYAQAYLRQRERTQSVRLERVNTYLVVRGNIAWATYQWNFAAVVDGQATSVQGHTTLVLEKRKEKWVVTLNHTSAVSAPQAQPAAPPQAPKPGP